MSNIDDDAILAFAWEVQTEIVDACLKRPRASMCDAIAKKLEEYGVKPGWIPHLSSVMLKDQLSIQYAVFRSAMWAVAAGPMCDSEDRVRMLTNIGYTTGIVTAFTEVSEDLSKEN